MCVLGCVMPPAGAVARSRNLGYTLFGQLCKKIPQICGQTAQSPSKMLVLGFVNLPLQPGRGITQPGTCLFEVVCVDFADRVGVKNSQNPVDIVGT